MYSEEFKRRIAKEYLEKKANGVQLAKKYGVSDVSIYLWAKKYSPPALIKNPEDYTIKLQNIIHEKDKEIALLKEDIQSCISIKSSIEEKEEKITSLNKELDTVKKSFLLLKVKLGLKLADEFIKNDAVTL